MRQLGGHKRIGAYSGRCGTCNRWNQQVRRLIATRLNERFPVEYEKVRIKVELDLYPQVLERFLAEHPEAARDPHAE